jgi:hypothetical protein
MTHGRRTVTVLAAAACLVVGGAVGSGLLNAGAATTGKGSSPTGSARPHGSNEDPAHETTEDAAREAAEDNGTATYGRHRDHGGFHSNEDPAHESSESAGREAQESPGASQPSEPDSGAATSSTPAT